jgi:DNA-binding MarR family transcriptional regulator
MSSAEPKRRKRLPPQPKVVLDYERHVSALIQIIANKLSSGASRLWRKQFGFGTIEYRVIALLAIKPGISPQVISQAIGFDKAAISRSIKNLQERGLVAITPDAKRTRSLHVTLTDAGYTTHDKIIPLGIERERRFVSCLSKAEVELLLEILARLHKMVPHANSPVASRHTEPKKTARTR